MSAAPRFGGTRIEVMDDVTIQDRAASARPLAPQEVGEGLSVISIAKSYDKRVVLSDVSLTVGKGEVVGLLGPNGAGKTTCFYSVMGLVKPDSGRIMLDGEDITGLPMYRRAILDEWVETGVRLDDLVAHVTIHEIGHHFGLSDDDMHALEDAVT